MYTDVKVRSQIWKRNVFRALYKTSHKKCIRRLQSNLQASCCSHDLTLCFLQEHSNPSPLTAIITLHTQLFSFLSSPQCICLVPNIQNPFLFALLRETEQMSSLTCQPIFREYISLPISNFKALGMEGKFVEATTQCQSAMQERARKQAHSNQV